MGQVLLIRHGQASFGADDYDHLSDLGREQSRLLGTWLGSSGYTATAVAVGRLRRHRQTAETCLAAGHQPAPPSSQWVVDPGLDEYDFDEVLRRHRQDLDGPAAMRDFLARSDAPLQAFQQVFFAAMERWTSGAHDGDYRESWRAFRERCVAALNRLVAGRPRSQNILIFTSGGPIAAICQHVLGLPDAHAIALCRPLLNSGVTRLLYRPGAIGLSYLNSVGHIETSGRRHLLTYR